MPRPKRDNSNAKPAKSTKPTKSTKPRRSRSKSTCLTTDASPEPYASDLDYLQDELDWIRARIHRIGAEVTLHRVLHPQESDDARSRSKELTPSELGRSIQRHGDIEQTQRSLVDARLAAHRAAGTPLGLDKLCETHGLDDFERTVILLAAAPCFSRWFDSAYSKLGYNEYSDSLTVEAAFAFAELGMAERIDRRRSFGPRAPLVRHDLIDLQVYRRVCGPKELLSLDIDIPGRTFKWLLGDSGLADELMEFSSLEVPIASLNQVVLPAGAERRILSVIERHDEYLARRAEWGFDEVIRYGRGVLMLFHGPPGTGKTMTAHAIAERMGKRIFNVDIPTFINHQEADRFLPGLFREARLHNALLFFDECETLFASRAGHGNALMTMLLTELERFEGVAILATNLPQRLDDALDRRILVKVRFPEPDRQAREEIWRRHLPAAAPVADDVDVAALADRFELTGGYIKNAVLVAVAQAVHEGGETPSITMAALEQAASEQMQPLGDDDEPVTIPKTRLADVVLPASLKDAIVELIGAARSRRTVLERWGIGGHLSYGKGVSALFHGEPGTGKTLCAEAVAGELNRPLLRASVPALLSKWVGETEANLEALFRRAKAQRAVLLLDEVDGLLAERGTGQAARHDDRAVNVLLQLIERSDGVTLLATNLPERLDRALARRLDWTLMFPFPSAAARAKVWRHLLPDTVPLDGVLDFKALGRFVLAGGDIKNAVFKAAFRAASAGRALDQATLVAAARQSVLARQAHDAAPMGFARKASC